MTDPKMHRLPVESIDLLSTPLSSLRSCSEYQASAERKSVIKKANEGSYWSFLNLFSQNEPKKTTKNKVRFADSNDSSEQEFLIQRLRFNPSNLLEDEDYDYSVPKRSWSTASRSRSRSGDSVSKELFKERRRRRSTTSPFVSEAVGMIDYVFGLHGERTRGSRSGSGEACMEIELQTLRPPQPLFVYTPDPSPQENFPSSSSLAHIAPTIREEPRQLGEIRRVTSLGSLQRISPPPPPSSHQPCPHVLPNTSPSPESAIEMALGYVQNEYRRGIEWCRATYRPNEVFYESIRIQPFSSGAYLRGMLLAGISCLFFQVYNIVTWSTLTPSVTATSLTLSHTLLTHVLYVILVIQIFLNVLCLPNRLRIHFQCWESSRAVEVDMAIHHIRTMLQSDPWVINRVLGGAQDVLVVFNIALTELYLWVTAHSDPLRPLVVSVCATNLLLFVCRVVVATVYSMSMHDPHVLSEARRRGLSKIDLETLPTFVYTCREEVVNSDCSICLGGFEMGEMLLSLPCDKKHSFHAQCIRQWLTRQNSCPLCQRLV